MRKNIAKFGSIGKLLSLIGIALIIGAGAHFSVVAKAESLTTAITQNKSVTAGNTSDTLENKSIIPILLPRFTRKDVLEFDISKFVKQADCAPSFSRPSTVLPNFSFDASSTDGITPSRQVLDIASPCAWRASTDVSWIIITQGVSGFGNGRVEFSGAINDSSARIGNLIITLTDSAGVSTNYNFVIVQGKGAPCNFSLSSNSVTIGASGGQVSTNVIAEPIPQPVIPPEPCKWTAHSYNLSLLAIISGASGSGAGTVSLSVAPNLVPNTRNLNIQIAGRVFVVQQAASATPPNIPTNVAAVPLSSTIVNVSWDAPAASDNVTHHNIRFTGPTGPIIMQQVQRPQRVSPLTPNTIYTFEVQAVNSFGASGWSAPVSATTPGITPIVSTAAFIGADTYTKGNWKGLYGAEGVSIIGDAGGLPDYVELTVSGQNPYTWAASTTDVRALRRVISNTERIASTFYTSSQMDLKFNLTDGQEHRLALYALDWEGNGRQQTFELRNTETGAVLDTRTINAFNGGRYLVWTVKGKVTVRIKNAGGTPPNAVVSGIFFDAAGTALPPAPPVIVPSATYVGEDGYTKGNWVGNYGAESKAVLGEVNILSALTSVTGQNAFTWVASTTDIRALRKISNNADRIASTYYTPNQMDLNFDFADGLAHRLSLYALDWEGNGRVQTFELLNGETGAVLDTRTINSFGGGRYVAWTVKGKMTVRVKKVAGPNAVVSGIFVDAAGTALPTPPPVIEPTASFVGADNYTKGNWVGNYGADGKQVIGDGVNLPAYAQLNITGQNPYTWAASTTEVRALRKASNNADRIAATFYTSSQMDLNFDLTDGQSHRLALYALDWEGNGRSQTYEMVNTDTGAILDTRTINNYNGGLYMVWTVRGKFTVRVKNAGGTPPNAVLSGIFFDVAGTALPTPPPPDPTSAAFVRVDTNTRGNWLSAHGGQGHSIVNDATVLPAYAQLSVTNQSAFSWMPSTNDVRALVKPANQSDRIASTYYAPNQFELNFNLTDGNTHRIALYALDWEGSTRQETFELVNTDSGAVLDTRTISNFNNGVYVVWDVRGKVTVRVKKVAGANAVLGGVFFDSLTADDATTGSFVGSNTNTQGNWMGAFGGQGYSIINDSQNFPIYARMTTLGQNAYTWTASTTDVRALTKATNNSDRIASTFYTPNQMDLSFYFTDEQLHKLTIYNLDWDTNNTRSQTLELINTTTGAVIDTRTINNFSNGVYTTWNVKGKVTVRVKKVTGPNAVISGVFIDN